MANRRSLLRKQLTEAWKRTIEQAYHDQLINSERGLQVHFCIELYKAFDEDERMRRLFVEPSLRFKGRKPRYPDLLICNSKEVIGVVEFKYTPRVRPAMTKDFKTLTMLSKAKGEVEVKNERFRGKGSPSTYTVASDAVLCWAAVHTSRNLQFPANKIGDRLLCLEAITSGGKDAQIRINDQPEA